MKNALHQKFMAVLTPYLKAPHQSTLLTTGKLTPDEFVAAGDSLVAVCPNWSWSPGVGSRLMDFLPPDKQFLINRRVVCQGRAADFKDLMSTESEIGDGWVQSGEAALEQAVDLDDDDEIVDLDALDLDSVQPDVAEPAAAVNRTYDLTICYDNYYNVPHVYLYGVNAVGVPLSLQEMYQDISADHAEKTVTYEDHPFLTGKFLSIHPCQHHNVILRLVERLETPERFCAPAYFFLFLKFIHTVVPTIDISTPPIEIGAEPE
jgi:ubiquitin-like-conjugating enzyme ATG3